MVGAFYGGQAGEWAGGEFGEIIYDHGVDVLKEIGRSQAHPDYDDDDYDDDDDFDEDDFDEDDSATDISSNQDTLPIGDNSYQDSDLDWGI